MFEKKNKANSDVVEKDNVPKTKLKSPCSLDLASYWLFKNANKPTKDDIKPDILELEKTSNSIVFPSYFSKLNLNWFYGVFVCISLIIILCFFYIFFPKYFDNSSSYLKKEGKLSFLPQKPDTQTPIAVSSSTQMVKILPKPSKPDARSAETPNYELKESRPAYIPNHKGELTKSSH